MNQLLLYTRATEKNGWEMEMQASTNEAKIIVFDEVGTI